MKIQIVYDTKTGYSIYFVSDGKVTYQGSVSTQAKADKVISDFVGTYAF